MKYDFRQVEDETLKFWSDNNIHARANAQAKEKGKGKKTFYFLDGPPYANGKIHLGTAWNKSLKDMVLRYKRMTGNAVWDRAGYDMHGLPTENALMKKLGMKDNEDIFELGVDQFIEKCREFCIQNMKEMNKDFTAMGVWMDFENAYQTISKEFMSGEWWLIKQAHEQGRLYEGLRTMTWCPITESALAKHELEYQTVTDDSIFVKFPLKGKENEHLIIWTTTPWTIPFNLAVMVGPEIEYVKVKVNHNGKEEFWYLANALVGAFLGSVVDTKFEIVEKLTGDKMEGWQYTHPFYTELKEHYDKIIKESPKAFSVLLSSEYVDTSAGSGLVHCAPGCGPEDYEVGHRNGIPPFNTLDTKGVYPQNMGKFSGWTAKKDDKKFIEALDEAGVLVASTPVEHEYPHDQRHHSPVIFRTTKQWFFKIEDIKEKLIAENDGINWVPEGAYRAFDSWLNNLRDNSISKQRFWGCPLPIWRNEDPQADDYIVIGSAKELEELSGQKVDDLHIPTVDKIIIKKDGKTYRRVPDVLDVWVDAGTTSWNCLDHDEELMKELFPADFILEGKDQIRGWFNLLHIASILGYNTKSFKACYMHGFINDAGGRKMSKSLGNYILPAEVIEKYGADTFRYYAIGAANPGVDMNYNFEDVDLKHRNLHVFWNVHKFLLDLQQTNDLLVALPDKTLLGAEEQYILSVYNRTVRDVTQKFEAYALNEVPLLIEACLLELSRTYIQLVREKASLGSDGEKAAVLWTGWTVFKGCMTMFATVAPFVTDRIYKNMKIQDNPFAIDQESIHLEEWPSADESFINEELEKDMIHAQSVISAILAAREKAQQGVRWPLAKVMVETQKKEIEHAITSLANLIRQQANVKEVLLEKAPVQLRVQPDFRTLGKEFGEKTPEVVEAIKRDADAIAQVLGTGEENFEVEGFALNKKMLQISYDPAPGSQVADFPGGLLAISTQTTPELEAEGYMRELVRRVQQLRKEEGLEKRDRIVLAIAGVKEILTRIAEHDEYLQEKVGASKLLFAAQLPELPIKREAVIKNHTFLLGLEKE